MLITISNPNKGSYNIQLGIAGLLSNKLRVSRPFIEHLLGCKNLDDLNKSYGYGNWIVDIQLTGKVELTYKGKA